LLYRTVYPTCLAHASARHWPGAATAAAASTDTGKFGRYTASEACSYAQALYDRVDVIKPLVGGGGGSGGGGGEPWTALTIARPDTRERPVPTPMWDRTYAVSRNGPDTTLASVIVTFDADSGEPIALSCSRAPDHEGNRSESVESGELPLGSHVGSGGIAAAAGAFVKAAAVRHLNAFYGREREALAWRFERDPTPAFPHTDSSMWAANLRRVDGKRSAMMTVDVNTGRLMFLRIRMRQAHHSRHSSTPG
jgi:hypothetical protein